MQVCIPTIGTKLKLSKPWYFTLHAEYRNRSLFEYTRLPYNEWYPWHWEEHKTPPPPPTVISLGAEVVLTIDRIYIRKGAKDFDSVSFILNGAKHNKRPVRFWAKLSDVNTIEGEYL